MQEEVENRVVTLVVNAGKLTEQELRKALAAALQMVQLHQEEAAARTRKLKTQSADPLRFALSRFRLDCASITPNNT